MIPCLDSGVGAPIGIASGTLVDELQAIVGRAGVVDGDAMAPYLAEARNLFRGSAAHVVRPAETSQVAAVVALCRARGRPVVAQGGNTGMCGGGVPTDRDAVVVSLERMNRVRAIDPVDFTMTVEAGCILADVQQAALDAGCFFPLSLGSEGSCRIGGNLSTNAGGVNVLRYGNARELVLGLEVVLPDGRIWDGLRALRKDNTGYALKHLFVGAEGTLGIVTAATLKLFPKPAAWHTAFVALDSPGQALRLLAAMRRGTGDAVTACELLPRIALDLGFKHMPGGRDPFQRPYPWYLLIEVSSSRAGTLDDAFEQVLGEAASDGAIHDAVVATSDTQRRSLWRLREIAAGGHQFQEGAIVKHDVAVPVSRVPEFIERATRAIEEAWPGARVIAFGHIGDGNVHFNVVQPAGADGAAFGAARGALNRIVHDLVAALGGSMSAEHGIGLLKIDEMARYKSDVELDLMRRIKRALDPDGLMNPGKVLPPAPDAGRPDPFAVSRS